MTDSLATNSVVSQNLVTKGKVSAKVLGEFIMIKQKLGEGSFAEVYKGYRKADKLPVAIKVINKGRIDNNPKMKSSLEFEISVLRRKEIDHSHIIELYAVHKSRNHYYLVMDYCGGGDLHKYIKENGPKGLPEPTVRKFASHIAKGLKCLRDLHIVHRDLKPQNLLLTSSDQHATIKIADFGLAREIQPQDLAGTFVGSPLYMAPEVLEGQKYNEKADLWSVGCILYEMFTGYPPYIAQNIVMLVKLIQEKKLIYPLSIPQEAVSLMEGLLQRDPNKRLSFVQFFDHPYLKPLLPAAPLDISLPTEENLLVNTPLEQIATNPISIPNIPSNQTVVNNSPEKEESISPLSSSPLSNLAASRTPRQPKVSPFKEAPIDKSLVIVDMENIPESKNETMSQSLTSLVAMTSSGHVTYPITIFDFSNLKYDTSNTSQVELVTELEESGKQAWVIAEAAFLNDKYNKNAEALSLYIKALHLLLYSFNTAKKVFSSEKTIEDHRISPGDSPTNPFHFMTPPSSVQQMIMATSKNVVIPDRIAAILVWIRTRYFDFLERADKVQNKLKAKPASPIESQDQPVSYPAEYLLYKYALKLAKESAYNEFVADNTNCVAMYTRAKLIFEYLLHKCEAFTLLPDRDALSKYIIMFNNRLQMLQQKQ